MLVRCCVSGPQGTRAARREQSTCPRRQNLLFRADAANSPLGTVAEALPTGLAGHNLVGQRPTAAAEEASLHAWTRAALSLRSILFYFIYRTWRIF